MNHADGEFLSTRKAAAALELSPRTLDRYLETGRGPLSRAITYPNKSAPHPFRPLT